VLTCLDLRQVGQLDSQVEEGRGCLTGAPAASVLTCLDLRQVGQLDSQVARSIRLWQEAHRQVVNIHKKASKQLVIGCYLTAQMANENYATVVRAQAFIAIRRQTDRSAELKDRQTESHFGCPTGRLSNLLLTD
jgi:hypothetical protein